MNNLKYAPITQREYEYIQEHKQLNKMRTSIQNIIKVNKEIEILKKKQTEIIEIKHTVSQIKVQWKAQPTERIL